MNSERVRKAAKEEAPSDFDKNKIKIHLRPIRKGVSNDKNLIPLITPKLLTKKDDGNDMEKQLRLPYVGNIVIT